MGKKTVAVIGMLVIVALVIGAVIWGQALATTTLSAAAGQQDVGSAMHDDYPEENHDTHHSDMHGENDAHHSGMHGDNDAHHSDMHGDNDTHHNGMH